MIGQLSANGQKIANLTVFLGSPGRSSAQPQPCGSAAQAAHIATLGLSVSVGGVGVARLSIASASRALACAVVIASLIHIHRLPISPCQTSQGQLSEAAKPQRSRRQIPQAAESPVPAAAVLADGDLQMTLFQHPHPPCGRSSTVTCCGAACARRWLGRFVVCSTASSTGHVIEGRVCAFVGGGGFVVRLVACVVTEAVNRGDGRNLLCLMIVDVWGGRDDGNLVSSCVQSRLLRHLAPTTPTWTAYLQRHVDMLEMDS